MKKLLRALTVVAIAATLTTSASAIPLPPLAGVPVSGQSDLVTFRPTHAGAGGVITVDWMVLDAAAFGHAGAFAYLYQVESGAFNPTHVDALSIGFNTAGVVAHGSLAGDDLDAATGFHPAHAVAGELDPFVLQPQPIASDLALDGITWSIIGGIDAGMQSETLYFIHPNPPVYGSAMALNSIAPSPWGSDAVHAQFGSGQQVPVPGRPVSVPDAGATMLLLGMAMTGLGLVGRKKKA